MEITKETALQRLKKLIVDKKRVEREMDEFLRLETSKKQALA